MNQEQQNKLDNLNYIKKIDKQDMAKFIKEMPEQIEKGINKARKLKLPFYFSKNIEQIVFCGMGGSAIAGTLISNLFKEQLKIPFFVIRDYHLPEFTNSKTLILLVSYSGNTRETLSCFFDAQKKKAKIIIISKNGELLKKAKENKLPFYQIKYEAPPRAALIHLFIPILVILDHLSIPLLQAQDRFLKRKGQPPLNPLLGKEGRGRLIEKKTDPSSFLRRQESSFKKLPDLLNKFNQLLKPEILEKENIAKQIAQQCYGRLPIIIAAEHLSGVNRRWKTQFNENSKNLAFFENLPELNHNLIEGLKFPSLNRSLLYFIILESPLYSTEIKKNFEFLKKFFQKQRFLFKTITGLKENNLTEALSLVLLGDWVSFYLSVLNKINPTPVKIIEKQKK